MLRRHARASSAGSTMRQGSRLGRIFRGAVAARASSLRFKGSGAPSFLVVAAAIALTSAVWASGASASSLPDGRAYEMVSPPQKNSGDVMPLPSRTRAAASGDAVAFTSLTSFGDVQGMGVTSEYVSRRDGGPGTNGWATHAIFPKLDPFSVNNVSVAGYNTGYVGEFSADLSIGILRTGTNLSGDPNLGTIANLYLRTDLLSAGAGSYSTVTLCSVCVSPFTQAQQNSFAGFGVATPDFTHILFESRLNLVPEASGGLIKLYEWDHGAVRLAGILPGGGMAPASIAGTGARASNYTLRTMSDDGRRIFFTDNSSTGNRTGDVYMRVDHATTVQLNASERTDCADQDPCTGDPAPDPNGPGPARFETASTQGTTVFFTSSEALTDSDKNDGPDLYMYDATLSDGDPHNLTQISLDSEGGDVAGATTGVLGASEDGSYVYFLHGSQLVSGGPSTDGHDGLYVWHDGVLRQIGTLTGGALDQDVNSQGSSFTLASLGSRVSPDGTHVLFTSHTGDGLTGYDQSSPNCDTPGCSELYLYDYGSESLTCASCNPTGAPATTDAAFTMRTAIGAAQPASHLGHALSDDGRYVFFTTAERLVPEDRNGKLDVYEYDSAAGQVHLLSTGTDPSDSFFLDASANGHDVFFVTRERLVGWDKDPAYDLYDARVGGGFPEPPPTPTECDDDVCQGALAGAPVAVKPLTSAFFSGNDNVKQGRKVRCGRNARKVRRSGKVHCVKKQAHGKKRNAKHNRGASR